MICPYCKQPTLVYRNGRYECDNCGHHSEDDTTRVINEVIQDEVKRRKHRNN